jgi:simple sugar transport system permease protein
MNTRLRKIGLSLVAPLAAFAFALLVGSIALLVVGVNPGFAFSEMLSFGATTDSFVSIVNRAIPLYISALAVALGFKMLMFNIGVEGQYLVAALMAAYVGSLFSVWAPLHILIMLLVAVVVGAIWAGIAALLKVWRGVHEVVSTIMLNYIAFSVVAYFLKNHFRSDPDSLNLSTPTLPLSGRFPSLNPVLESIGMHPSSGFDLHGYLIIAILLGVLYYVLVWKTRFGFDLRASGVNPGAALFSGVKPKRMVVYTMLISGGIAGLVGMGQVTSYFYAYTQDFPRFLGFDGIAVALLGRNNPAGMGVAALVIGFLRRSSQILDLRGVPREISVIIEGVVVLAVVVAYEVVTRRIQAAEIKAASEATEAGARAEVTA